MEGLGFSLNARQSPIELGDASALVEMRLPVLVRPTSLFFGRRFELFFCVRIVHIVRTLVFHSLIADVPKRGIRCVVRIIVDRPQVG